ncbi:oxidoreductase [Cupriavidus plantarum]|uniref:oxidoreductase n=1 Tax=Cupriavidus plantarum TaxID=942865 RepID=UPI001B0E08A7|nr:oxidoreductase [Cupriavidus plantarum]CAG2153034.1 NADPH dehydrogenase [Cupriavidus plantarum]SMR65970.1 2,4-dienoyl-CoA reductase [Cupriavidus plantarum]
MTAKPCNGSPVLGRSGFAASALGSTALAASALSPGTPGTILRPACRRGRAPRRPRLLRPLTIDGLELLNRVVIAPMRQYAANDGCMSDWHLIHLGRLALSGAALLAIEHTAVLPEGRSTHADLGLWNSMTEAAMGLTIESLRRWSDMPIAILLSHAGRRGSNDIPGHSSGVASAQIGPAEGLGWQTVAPSALAYDSGHVLPEVLDHQDMRVIREAFVAAARRAVNVGVDAVFIDAAGGHLLHQFLSPLSNRRNDLYGGTLQNRLRFPLEVFAAVRDALPQGRPLACRIPAQDWMGQGWDLEQASVFVRCLATQGCNAFYVSAGGLLAGENVPYGAGYLVPLARALRQETGLPVIATGAITGFEQAEAIIGTGDADLVAIDQAILDDPFWPRHAGVQLCGRAQAAHPWARGQDGGMQWAGD